MLQFGQKQKLEVIKTVDFGAYLGTEEEKVLLPAKQVPEGCRVGDEIEVFLYKDSEDRPIATTREPKMTLGEVALLKVKDITRIGAFLDWGLERDLFLPFKEQTKELHKGEEILAALYIDKSDRLAATMKIYPYLPAGGDFAKDQEVQGRVYEISRNFGAFVAIDDQYQGLIPAKQLFGEQKVHVGDWITARVSIVHEDGKVDLDLRQKAYLQMDEDAERILELLQQKGGKLPIGDKSSPAEIIEITGMSKNQFKRAIGHLYKEHQVTLEAKEVRLVKG
ncbi:MAG: S1 RNA-binding domain-containing protein [Lachnospiraceae bacterium]|nr:S1 RNA-binding domain-containing protein [Lachnospiraceae bacterium]